MKLGAFCMNLSLNTSHVSGNAVHMLGDINSTPTRERQGYVEDFL
jgi:hypothetical protein